MFCLTIYERDVYILFDADARVSLHVISNKIIKFSLVFSFFYLHCIRVLQTLNN